MIKRIARIFSVILIFALMGNIVYAADSGSSQEAYIGNNGESIEDIFSKETINEISEQYVDDEQYDEIIDTIETFEIMGLISDSNSECLKDIDAESPDSTIYTLQYGDIINEIEVKEKEDSKKLFEATVYQNNIKNEISYDEQGNLWVDGYCYDCNNDGNIKKCSSVSWTSYPPYGNSSTYSYYGGNIGFPEIYFHTKIKNLTFSAFSSIIVSTLSSSAVFGAIGGIVSWLLIDYYTDLSYWYPMQACASMSATFYNPGPGGSTYVNNQIGFVQEYNFKFYAYNYYNTLINTKTAYYRRTVY